MQVAFKRTTSDDPMLKELICMLDKELRQRNGEIQDVLDQYNIIQQSYKVVLAYVGAVPVACGCFKEFDPHTIEIKRMFVRGGYRGKGIASAILRELETWGNELNYAVAVLETGTRLHEAVKLYNKMGYSVRAQYGQYIEMENSVCMEKAL